MLTHPVINQLKEMKLLGMAEALTEQLQDPTINNLSLEELLGLLIDREAAMRSSKLLQSRLKVAKLHCNNACIADIDYHNERGLDKKVIDHIATGEWLRKAVNITLTGATGTGKSWLACAFAHKSCMLGYRVQYWRISRLLEELHLAKADGRYLNIVKKLSSIQLLILDDWGMVKIVGVNQQYLLDILDDRYQKASTIITSQLPTKSWYEQINDTTFADAIIDRMLGRSLYSINLHGKSMRNLD